MSVEYSDIEDQFLVMDAQDGDISAMEKLVTRWQKRLWRHAYRLTNDIQAAWDVTQQSWLGIIKGLNRLEDPANFKSWAYRITTNKAADWCKKKNAIHQVACERLESIESKEKKDIGIKEMLGKLDIRKRMVVSLYYFEQMGVSEISQVLNIPAGTVKSRLSAARNDLKELWRKNE
jgi:RNA polymerase sigma-70 factor (ECF subfamily)